MNETNTQSGAAVPSNDWVEIYRDESYYGLWAVRPAGENRWGHCFHVQTKEEAEGLRDLLNYLQFRLIEKLALAIRAEGLRDLLNLQEKANAAVNVAPLAARKVDELVGTGNKEDGK